MTQDHLFLTLWRSPDFEAFILNTTQNKGNGVKDVKMEGIGDLSKREVYLPDIQPSVCPRGNLAALGTLYGHTWVPFNKGAIRCMTRKTSYKYNNSYQKTISPLRQGTFI